ncbi:hypothetical protein [Roseibium album]|uniref:hypothetical protein n=1 Tax=Roseibium album TaxID=311410 RepID=UPI00391BC872
MDYLSRDEYDLLSIASKDLVKMAGGPTRALEITGYRQKTQIDRCTTVAGADRRFFPIKAIAELEADVVESGRIPPVTKCLAELAGFDLVRREACKGDRSALEGQAELATAYADATAALSLAYADQIFTDEEQAGCLAKLEALVDVSSRLIATVRNQKTTAEEKEI